MFHRAGISKKFKPWHLTIHSHMDLEKLDEEVLMNMKPARRRFTKQYVAAFIWVLVSVFVLYSGWAIPLQGQLPRPDLLVSAFFFSASFIFFIYAEARRAVEHYIITDNAVYEDIGIFTDRHTNLPFMKLQRCGIHRPFMEKIMGIGDVRVDAGRDFFIIKGVANADEVERLIEKRMREVMSGGNVGALHQ